GIAAAKRINPQPLVLYHSDGNVEAMIDGFIEAGVDILDPLQPECMDIFALKVPNQAIALACGYWNHLPRFGKAVHRRTVTLPHQAKISR
ncbi:hypothetical protein B1B_00882, partial [mine drainage metagenome]